MKITHITAECYPAAKAGGLGDVAGALPKYLNKEGHSAEVLLPFYETDWLKNVETELIYEGTFPYHSKSFPFSIHRVKKSKLGFELYLVEIPGRFDRPGIYIDPWSGHPYWDERERFFSFQIASLEWLISRQSRPDIIHCHDHHTALVPFMMKECFRFDAFRDIPSVLTIHNGEYQGRYPMDVYQSLPAFNLQNLGVLQWDEGLNCLAAGIKSSWKVTTVSRGYMKELLTFCNGLEILLQHEQEKTMGIVNGIDPEVWNPKTDPLIDTNYTTTKADVGKEKNKKALSEFFSIPGDRPLFSFIGRLVREKGADLLPDLIRSCHSQGVEASFIVLGTGDPSLHNLFKKLESEYVGYFDSRLEYNEQLAHLIYAGSDFLMMPSRVEPCGLNQFYSMRYGTIPVVRGVGGLADTVIDISHNDGYGIVFDNFNLEEFVEAVKRGVDIFGKKELFENVRKKVMKLDFSWKRSTKEYIEMYKSIIPK
ncbi:glycogen synthase [Rhodohalobacter sp. SW132]|uniref:glycogen synthase n=1 Tax=Rhodohalobacter sp. SW132 TaxID=2293433 RepID=UPI000E2798DF|nr:glycogen synthase [Rhodohalobacter sp. SW132]REL38176.1 glycogen synthase [Rhodohalobacter sp. SW132]